MVTTTGELVSRSGDLYNYLPVKNDRNDDDINRPYYYYYPAIIENYYFIILILYDFCIIL
jgi:hypothetical protein